MKEYVKILIAESRTILRNLLLKILEKEGYKVTLVSDLDRMFESMRSGNFDILLVDMKLFSDNNDDKLKIAIDEFKNSSVIAMTPFGDTDSVSRALANGADKYISKPFKSDEVSLIIQEAYLKLTSKRSSLSKTEKVTG